MAYREKTKLDYQMERELHKAWIRKHRKFHPLFTVGVVAGVTILVYAKLSARFPILGEYPMMILFFLTVGISFSYWYSHTNGFAKAAKKREKERLEQKNKNRY